MINNEQRIGRAVGAGFYPARAVQHHEIECTNAKRYAPVGADDPVRPAGCTCKHKCTNANVRNVCRGRCRALPARRTTVFTIHYGTFAIAPRADRGVRPYRTFCVFAETACNFAIAHRRGDVGIDPYGRIALSLFVVRICDCTPRGRGEPRPYITTKNGRNPKTVSYIISDSARTYNYF